MLAHVWWRRPNHGVVSKREYATLQRTVSVVAALVRDVELHDDLVLSIATAVCLRSSRRSVLNSSCKGGRNRLQCLHTRKLVVVLRTAARWGLCRGRDRQSIYTHNTPHTHNKNAPTLELLLLLTHGGGHGGGHGCCHGEAGEVVQ